MMRELVLSDLFRRDLEKILEYLDHHSPPAALRFRRRMEDLVRLIRSQPKLGRSRDDLETGMRSRVVGDYLLFYTYDDAFLNIARLVHGARDIDRIMRDDAD